MKLGSLFDGSGGFPLAGFLCGIEPCWAAEVEPYPIAVTRSRFPSMKHLGSVTDINGAEIEPVNVITFGSPCQDLSVAGKRAGLKHEANGDEETTRSGLFMEAVRIIKEMREATNGRYPDFVLWENVPGAFSSNNGEDFRTVLAELIRVVEPYAAMPKVPKAGWAYADSFSGCGWSLAYRVFDAQYWGVPQRRRRIHLVLDLRGERAREVLFEREGLRGYFAQSGEPGQATAADAEGGSGADDREGKNCLNPWDSQTIRVYAANGVFPTLSRNSGGGQNRQSVCIPCYPRVAHSLTARHDGSPIPDKKSGANVVVVPRTFQNTGIGWWNESPIGQTLRTPCGGDSTMANVVIEALPFDTTQVTSPQNGNNPKWGDPCHPLAAQGHPPTVICKGMHLFENHSQDTRYKGPLDVCPMLPAQLGTGGNNTPFVVEEDRPVYCLQGSMLGRADKNGPQGDGVNEGGSFTLNTTDRHAVAYPYDAIQYIVRRLTPTECARLQGFADRWGEIDEKNDFTQEEFQFWLDVRNTHAAINGKTVKEYTKEQMLKWYNKLHTDSAEYKMWGNGIALPPALYCMQGISDALNRERS